LLLRRITLKNIRSYNDDRSVDVEIPQGTVLLEGDVGSGKSSILYAIEFALFGLGEMSGEYMLSEGKDEGHVSLEFTVDGHDYEAHRGLKRHRTGVAQANCYLSANGERSELSASDLKEKVIALLNFKEPQHPKAESMVYRFAVFTPQEQMKEILLRNAEDRLQVLRRVLGVQSYQAAGENAQTLERRLRTNAHGLQKASEDLGEKEDLSRSVSDHVADLESKIPELERHERAADEIFRRLDSDWKGLRDQREQLGRVVGKIPELEHAITRTVGVTQDETERANRLETRVKDEYLSFVNAFSARRSPVYPNLALVSSLIQQRQKDLREKQKALTVLETGLAETQELITQGVCPRCGQKISEGYVGRTAHLKEEVERLQPEIDAMEEELLRLQANQEETKSYERDKEQNARMVREASNAEREIAAARTRINDSQAEEERLRHQLSIARDEEGSLKDVSDRIDRTERERSEALREKDSASRRLVAANSDRSNELKRLEELSVEIAQKKKKLAEAKKLAEYEGWLSDYFRPALQVIENQTLVQINARFNYHFQRFFSALVEDPDLNVRVKEDFSPVFERQGFDQDFETLSGGERTSIALAYRFAVSVIAAEDTSGQGELVILDEPTDGFSKEQIYKMRDLLEELHSKQVLLVSHERELESMSDVVFRVEKVNATSRITRS
jgi:exonuclease SbcC